MANFKILGFTEECNTCECCGKTNLKGTYCVDSDSGIVHYGSVCVKRNLGLSKDSDVKNKITEYTMEIKRQARDFYRSLGGYEIESKMESIEFASNEWSILDEKYEQIKKQTLKKFNIASF